jgi:hypothetical protein
MVLCVRGLTLCFDVNSALSWMRMVALMLSAVFIPSTVFDEPILSYSQFKGKRFLCLLAGENGEVNPWFGKMSL